MKDLVERHEYEVGYSDTRRVRVADWYRSVDIDPSDVKANGWVEIDHKTFMIRWLGFDNARLAVPKQMLVTVSEIPPFPT